MTQPTLPGLEQDRQNYVRIRLESIYKILQAYERNPNVWRHCAQTCSCAACTERRALVQERETLLREVNARAAANRKQARATEDRAAVAKQARGRKLARQAGHCAGIGRARAGLNRPATGQDYNGIGESGFRPGWDYWDR